MTAWDLAIDADVLPAVPYWSFRTLMPRYPDWIAVSLLATTHARLRI